MTTELSPSFRETDSGPLFHLERGAPRGMQAPGAETFFSRQNVMSCEADKARGVTVLCKTSC